MFLYPLFSFWSASNFLPSALHFIPPRRGGGGGEKFATIYTPAFFSPFPLLPFLSSSLRPFFLIALPPIPAPTTYNGRTLEGRVMLVSESEIQIMLSFLSICIFSSFLSSSLLLSFLSPSFPSHPSASHTGANDLQWPHL